MIFCAFNRQDQFTITSPGVKFLVYKDCKKNIHRVKVRTDRKNANNTKAENAYDLSVDVDDQFLKDNLNTMEKMHRLRAQLESKKRDKHTKPNRSYSLAIGGDSWVNSPAKSYENRTDAHSRHLYLPLSRYATDENRASGSNKRSLSSLPTKSRTNEIGVQTLQSRRDDTAWPTNAIDEVDNAKQKSNKSNLLYDLIEMMKTSKMPTTSNDTAESNKAGNSDRLCDDRSQSKSVTCDSVAAALLKQSTSDEYRYKLRENIRRNRSFKFSHVNDLFVEESQVNVLRHMLCVHYF